MNFAPYAPPPDERRKTNSSGGSSKPESTPSWQSKPNTSTNPWSSYQHGGAVVDPTGISSQSSHQPLPKSFSNQGTNDSTNPYSRNFAQETSPSSDLRRGAGTTYLNAEAYETRLGWRVDLLSGMAYLTPLMGFIILVIETKNDYVRIHAYQSLLTAIPLGILHFLLLSSRFFQSLLLFFDLGLYIWLGYQAYCSAEMLERNLLPTIGPIAEQWTAEE